ncbi:LolA family protein [Namhaeicola litoreus]|uniref:Outer membrane lipoprotein carrier protein LolA n=1 Tax=Namhaeicola litoreus TaxID=1052145 RepID=A0ABW3Y720_9FLAO
MKKHVVLIAFLVSCSQLFAQNNPGKALLDKVHNNIKSFKNVVIEFDYTLENKAENVKQTNSGKAALEGEKYRVDLFGTTQIFDGTKTYTIVPDNEEVNISNTEENNENTLTPSKFYSFYQNGYTYKMLGAKSEGNKKIEFVQLDPIDSESDTEKIVIGIDAKKNQIENITETGKNGTQTILSVKKFLSNQSLPANTFNFDEKKYTSMGYLIND